MGSACHRGEAFRWILSVMRRFRTHFSRLTLLAACATLLVALLPATANAQTKQVRDRRDTFGGGLTPKVAAPKDIRHVRFTNKRARVVAVVRLRRLWRGSTGWTQLNLAVGYRKSYFVTVVRRKDGSESIRRHDVRRHCPKLKARYVVKRNRVRFSIPQRCLRDRGRHRWEMSAYVGGLPTRDANAWDGSRSVRVRYR